jgi:hypothetical protein
MERSFWNALLRRMGNQARPTPGRVRHSFRPALLALEDRTVPTILSVTDYGASDLGAVDQVLADPTNSDIIQFDHSLTGRNVDLSSGTILLDKNLSITGLGSSQLTITGGSHSVFNITANVTLSDLKLSRSSSTTFDTGMMGPDSQVSTGAHIGIEGLSPDARTGLAGRMANLLGRAHLDIIDNLIASDAARTSDGAPDNQGLLGPNTDSLADDTAPDFAGILDAFEYSTDAVDFG